MNAAFHARNRPGTEYGPVGNRSRLPQNGELVDDDAHAPLAAGARFVSDDTEISCRRHWLRKAEPTAPPLTSRLLPTSF